MIPRVLHQIWVGPKPMPERWRAGWIKALPDWTHVLWDEAAIRELPVCNGAAFEWYMAHGDYMGAADVARVEILYHVGGVYADIDSECLQPFGDAGFMAAGFFAGFANPRADRPGRIANGVLGSEAAHPVLVTYLELIAAQRRLHPAWDTVGGTLLTAAVSVHQDRPDVQIMPPRVFYPESSRGRSAPGNEPSYTRHYWAGTHRAYP